MKLTIELTGLDELKEKLEHLNKMAVEIISLAEDIKTTTISAKPHIT